MRYEMKSLYTYYIQDTKRLAVACLPGALELERQTSHDDIKEFTMSFLLFILSLSFPFLLFHFFLCLSLLPVSPSSVIQHNTDRAKYCNYNSISPSVLYISPSPSLQTFIFFSLSLCLYFTHSFFLLSRSLTPTTGVLRASNQSASERLLFLERLQPSGREMQRWREEKCT